VFTVDEHHALDIHVDMEGNVVKSFDMMQWSSYEVQGIPDLTPDYGERIVLFNPENETTSPNKWNRQEVAAFTTSVGNNVWAQDNPTGGATWQNNYRPNPGESLAFVYPFNRAQQPVTYRDAAISNLFYWNNIIHDIFYANGFTEVAGNFQEFNFGKGGLQGDAVQANAQDGAGFNNANFLTPVDGQRPRMRMYLWNAHNPMRDGDMDSGIIVHEYAHGISNRLTGGPSNVGCLPGGQAGGMGEGWGDAFAIWFESRESTVREDMFPMGEYAAGNGIRPFPYSGTFTNNPQTYDYMNRPGYTAVHSIGSVWCQTLFQVYWELRDEFGWNPNWFYGPTGEEGNLILISVVTQGMKLQPCIPNFLSARDAILLADEQLYASAHRCAIWRGFAARGVGVNAVFRANNNVDEDFDTPADCPNRK